MSLVLWLNASTSLLPSVYFRFCNHYEKIVLVKSNFEREFICLVKTSPADVVKLGVTVRILRDARADSPMLLP